MPTPTSKVITGARCRVQVDGKTVGFASNVSYTAQDVYQEQQSLDNYEVAELVPVRYTVAGRIGLIRISGRNARTMGLIPKAGKDADEHLANVLAQKDAVLALYDKGVSKNMAYVHGVRFTGHGLTVQAGGIAGEDIPFMAIRDTDESEATT